MGDGTMHRVGKNNAEYMAVLEKVVECLVTELHNPKLQPFSAEELTYWLRHVNEGEVEAALSSLSKKRKLHLTERKN